MVVRVDDSFEKKNGKRFFFLRKKCVTINYKKNIATFSIGVKQHFLR